MNKKIEKICLAIIFWGSCLILFLPIFVYRDVHYPYIFSKMVFFNILVEIIFTSWMCLMIYHKKYRPSWKNSLIIFSTIFVVILLFSTLTGVDLQRSFWSIQERMTGVFNLLHLWLWFLILSSTLKEKKHWFNLIWVSLVCSLLVGLYGLAQKFNLWFAIKDDVSQLSSTLGNPIYLSVYAMINLFLGIFFIFLQDGWRKKIAIFFSVFNFIIMLWGASRGVFLAFGLSILLFIIFLLFKIRQKRIKYIFGALLLIIIIFFILLPTQADKEWIKKMPTIIQRMAGWQASSSERIDTWEIAWQGFIERPILGWGWENFNVVFNKYYLPYYLRYSFLNTWFDHSHNQMMDFLVLTGILGTTAYLLFYGSAFFLIFKKIKENKKLAVKTSKSNHLAFIILTLMLVSYFFQNLTVFDTPAPLILLYFSLGLVYFVTSQNFLMGQSVKADEDKDKNIGKAQKLKNLSALILIPSTIFIIFVLYQFNIKPFLASAEAIEASRVIAVVPGEGVRLFKKSLERNTFINPEVRLLLIKKVMEERVLANNNVSKNDLDFLISETEKNVSEHPRDARYWLFLGQLYNVVASQDRVYLVKAEKALEKAKELSPNRQQVYYVLSQNKFLQGNYEEAINLAKRAVDLDPEVGESHKNLGLIYLQVQNLKDGLKEIEEASKTIDPYVDFANALYISSSYFRVGEVKKAVFIAELTRDRNPNNFQAFIHLAFLYKEIGDKVGAINAAQKAMELNPSLEVEGKNFIDSLK